MKWLFLPWMTVYRWHDLNNWRQMTCVLYPWNIEHENWHILTWQKQQNICVNSESGLIFDWKKEESDYCYERSNMYMYERMKIIQLLIFFFSNQKLRHIQKLRMTSQRRWQYRIDQSTDMLYVIRLR